MFPQHLANDKCLPVDCTFPILNIVYFLINSLFTRFRRSANAVRFKPFTKAYKTQWDICIIEFHVVEYKLALIYVSMATLRILFAIFYLLLLETRLCAMLQLCAFSIRGFINLQISDCGHSINLWYEYSYSSKKNQIDEHKPISSSTF